MFVVLQCMAGDRGKDRIAYGPYLYALEPDILATLTIHGASMQVLRCHIVKAIMHCPMAYTDIVHCMLSANLQIWRALCWGMVHVASPLHLFHKLI